MNMTLTTSRARRVSTWSQMKNRIVEWRRRSYSRHELGSLNDMTLRDIGLSRADAEFEASKPFWMT
jgi:uncharacterized protein YjiS (DUF1127 family)